MAIFKGKLTNPRNQYAFAYRYMADGETITVHYLLNQLVGQYFEIVK